MNNMLQRKKTIFTKDKKNKKEKCPKDAVDNFRENICGKKHPEYSYSCSRNAGHDGWHHSHNSKGECILKWIDKEKLW